MDDLIRRQAALNAMDTWDKFGCDPDGKLVRYDDDKHYVPYVHYDDMVHVIKCLPSAQPEYTEQDVRDSFNSGYACGMEAAQSEIIRCRDCRYGVDYYHDGNCYCAKPGYELLYFDGSWDFYCANAEREVKNE